MKKGSTVLDTITVQECQRCGQSHTFSFRVTIEEITAIGLAGVATATPTKTSCFSLVFTCPVKLDHIVVDVPVTVDIGTRVVKVVPAG